MKMGRLTVGEIAYIRKNHEKKTVEEIAKYLDRDVKSIVKYIEENIGFSSTDKNEVEGRLQLENRPYYIDLKQQFLEQELTTIKYTFQKMWSQFRDDVMFTEELQIIDVAKTEVLMNRTLVAQRETMKKVEELEFDLRAERELGVNDADTSSRDKIILLERQISILKSSQESLSREYKELQSRKAASLKDLKGTRDQRYKNVIEDSKKTFTAFISLLLTDVKYRKDIGREMEMARIAAEDERKKLYEDYVYNDGVIDKPLLCKESILLEKQKEKEQNND